MKRARWMTAAAAMMMAALGAIGGGCSDTVEIGQNPTCPAVMPKAGQACDAAATGCTYPDGPCSMVLACDGKGASWKVKDATCSPAAVSCGSAADGDICAIPGDSCGESPGPCEGGFMMSCGADHLWHSEVLGGVDCCPQQGPCPVDIPLSGDACDSCNGPPTCTYETQCGGAVATCGPQGAWLVSQDGCPPPPPGDPCQSHADEGACGKDPTCRWLTPGCADPKLPAAGCFGAGNCTPETMCGAGETCQTANYNPCYGKKCDACGATAQVCLPAPVP